MTKIKIKSKRAAGKRFKITGTGKVKRTKGNRKHLFATKTRRQKKAGRVLNVLVDSTMEKNVKKMLPYS